MLAMNFRVDKARIRKK